MKESKKQAIIKYLRDQQYSINQPSKGKYVCNGRAILK